MYKTIVMTTKRKSSSKKKKHPVNISVIIIIVALIAILSYAISYLFIHDASDEEMVTTNRNQTEMEQPAKGNTTIITLLEGSWYSEYDGSILTIGNNSFKLEFPGVDGSKITKGSVIIKGDEVILMNQSNSKTCVDKPGKYKWSVSNKTKLSFTKINDPCPGRVERMVAGWERI